MMNFTFDEEMIDTALEANGWFAHWHPDNWVHTNDTNKDWSGMSKKKAFENMLSAKNLIPRDKNEKCWDKVVK